MNSDAKMICRSIDKLTDEVIKLRKSIQKQNIRTEERTYIGDDEENCTEESPPI